MPIILSRYNANFILLSEYRSHGIYVDSIQYKIIRSERKSKLIADDCLWDTKLYVRTGSMHDITIFYVHLT